MSQQGMSVAFVGLGIVGAPMAKNILEAGFGLKVYNRTASKVEPFREGGAAVAASPAQAAADSDVVVVCVSDTPDVLSVVLEGEHAIAAGVKEGAIVIDFSTDGRGRFPAGLLRGLPPQGPPPRPRSGARPRCAAACDRRG